MQVGDLVTAPHWVSGCIGLVVEVRLRAGWSQGICKVMMNDGTAIDQLIKDLEIINKKT